MKISDETLAEVARVGREWPDGVHTCAQLQQLEPGRRPCTCGRCPQLPRRVPGATLTEVASFGIIPARCHCGWAVKVTEPGALWTLSEPFTGCPVHGEAVQQI